VLVADDCGAGWPAKPLEEAKEIVQAARVMTQSSAEPILPSGSPDAPPLRVGDTVYLRSLGTEGILQDLGEREAEVQIGRLRVRASVEDLAPARPVAGPQRSAGPASSPRVVQEISSSMEVDLRGLPVDEALDVLEQRLDSAYLSGLPFVRVIHGKGTGRLRQAIRRELRDNPYAAGFEAGKDAEGGEGVTVVKLATG
jgi:DNA mismatch repair protein MutS2